MSTTLTVKGQVTIPKTMREHLGLKPGDGVDFEFLDNASIRLPPARAKAKKPVKDHFGLLVGVLGRGHDADELMEMLRGYSEDKDDSGFRSSSLIPASFSTSWTRIPSGSIGRETNSTRGSLGGRSSSIR